MRHYKRLLAVVLFLGLLWGIFYLLGFQEHYSLPYLQQLIEENKSTGLLVFVLLFALGNLLYVPGLIFLAAAVIALGKTWGGVITYFAATLACLTTFLTIRYIGDRALRQINNKIAKSMLAKLDSRPLGIIITLRILFQTTSVLNYTLALSGVKFRHYLIGTLIGLPLPIAVYCWFFDYLAKVLKIV